MESAFDSFVASSAAPTTAPAVGPKAAPATTAPAASGGSAFDSFLGSNNISSNISTTANINPAPAPSLFSKTLSTISSLGSATKGLFAAPTPSTSVVPNVISNTNKDLNTKINNVVLNTGENLFPTTSATIKSIGADPANLKANPKQALSDAWDNVKDLVKIEGQNIKSIFKTPGAAGKVNAGLESVTGAANVAFSPITALFSAANDIPVLGTIAKTVSLPFSVAGDAGKDAGKLAVKALPISPKAKAQLSGGIEDIFSLAAQILVGEGISEGVKAGLVTKYGETDAATIEAKAQALAEADKAHSATENAKALDMNKMTTSDHPDAKAVTATLQNEVNDMSKTTSPEDLKANLDNHLGVNGDATDALVNNAAPQGNAIDALLKKPDETAISETSENEPTDQNAPKVDVNQPAVPQLKPEETPVKEGETPMTEPKPDETPVEKPVDDGEKGTSGVASNSKDRAVEAGIKADFGDLPEYTKMNMADQAAKANDLLEKDPELAKKIAMGQEIPPGDLRAGSVYKAVELKAHTEGDAQTALDLAHSPLSEVISKHAQELKALDTGSRDTATKNIKDVEEARQKAVEKRTGTTVKKAVSDDVKDAQKEMKKATSKITKQTWGEFIDQIKCNY